MPQVRSIVFLAASSVVVGALASPAGSRAAAAPEAAVEYSDLLSIDSVGARDFIRKHPTWDGRGAVVAVLDTGVDMSVEGLTKTSTGEVKVIEARDFSGQGIVHMRKPENGAENGEPVLKTGDGALRGHGQLKAAPKPESLLIGFLEERRFKNSSVSDVNENGKNDDRFGILMGQVTVEGKETAWAAWVDTDADGHIDDEEMLKDYSVAQQFFFFKAKVEQRGDVTMAVALTLAPERKEVVLHFPDGSHGTHVAGIAAGFRLYGREGFNGIAPGAQVMSLKIGDNTLSGGSTTTESMKKAIEFAGSWSQSHSRPVVVNVSYGIGEELEGLSDIDRVTDRLLQKYPLLSVASSAGNSGPGLSTVGTPAGAGLAFAAGGLLTKENARSLFGGKITKDVIFYFSSRGGELAKPDGLAPGVALSSIPQWESFGVMRGTSMASPQAAGCLALLASAAVQSPDKPVFHGGLLARGLRNSGRPLAGYSLPDQGPGVVNVPAAWEALKKLGKRKHAGLIAGFQVSADCATCPDGKAQAAYFRSGTYVPGADDPISFNITPLFTQEDAEKRKAYFETVELVTEGADWLELSHTALFFKGADSAAVDVTLSPEKLRSPGLYSARVFGVSRESGRGKDGSLFELWCTVIVPHVFDVSSGLSRSFPALSLAPGEVRRTFIRVPEGASSLAIELAPTKGKFAQSQLKLFDPEGHEWTFEKAFADSLKDARAEAVIPKGDLAPGVWEIVSVTLYTARGPSTVDLNVEFSGFQVEAPEEFDYEMGSPPRSSFRIRTLFDHMFQGRAEGGLQGLYRKQEYSSGSDKIVFTLTLEKEVSKARLKMAMTPETYGRFTDCAVNVLDGTGRAVEKDGFSTRFLTLDVENPSAGKADTSYTVEIIGAFAEKTDARWSIAAEEFYFKRQPIEAKTWCEAYALFTLYPNKEYNCEFELQDKPTVLPSGFQYFGELRFRNERTKKLELLLPLRLKPTE